MLVLPMLVLPCWYFQWEHSNLGTSDVGTSNVGTSNVHISNVGISNVGTSDVGTIISPISNAHSITRIGSVPHSDVFKKFLGLSNADNTDLIMEKKVVRS